MTIPPLDWGRVNSYRDGPLAAKDNADWIRNQADAITRLKAEIDAMHAGWGTRMANYGPAGTTPAAPKETPLGGFVDPNGHLAKIAQGAPLQFRGGMNEMDYADVSNMDANELVGRARALGADKAEEMPQAALQAMIMQRRADTPQEDHSLLFNMASQYARFGIQGTKTMFGMLQQANRGIGGVVERGLEHTPVPQFFKDWGKDVLTKIDHTEQAKQYLSQMDESIRMNLTGKEQNGYLVRAAGEGTAQVAAAGLLLQATMAALGSGVGASVLGRLGAGAIGRGAIAGAMVSTGLDFGSDKQWLPSMSDFSSVFKANQTIGEHAGSAANLAFGSRLMNTVTGAALGAAFGKLEQHFQTKQGSLNEQARMKAGAAGERQHLEAYNESQGGPPRGGERWADYFLNDGIEDAVWEIVPDAPPPPMELNAGTPALEAQYLRRLGPGAPQIGAGPTATEPVGPAGLLGPGEVGSSGVGPVQSPVTPTAGGPRLLQGPITSDAASGLQWAKTSIIQIDHQLAELANPLPPDPTRIYPQRTYTAEQLLDQRQAYQQQIDALETRRATTTFEDAAPAIVQLKANMRDMTQRMEMLPPDHPALPHIGAELESMQGQLEALRTSAGGPSRTSRNDPTPDFAFNQNRPSPATPARDLAKAAGGKYKDANGNQTMFLHGGATEYKDIAADQLNTTGNLYDGGFYLSTSPTVTGGDITDFEEDSGYAGGRASTIDQVRRESKEQLNYLTQQMSAYQTQGPASGITDEAAANMQTHIDHHQNVLNTVGEAAPNVRPMFLAVTKMLEAEKPVAYGTPGFDEALSILHRASDSAVWENAQPQLTEMVKALQTGQMSPTFDGFIHSQDTGVNMHHVYQKLATIADKSFEQKTPEPGKTSLNLMLQDMGYDGVEYEGGKRLRRNGERHLAVAVFDHRKLIHAYLGEEETAQAAAKLGINLAKQNAILGSPVMPALIAEAVPDDATVIKAQLTTDPGAYHILKGVADPVALVTKLVSEDFQGQLAGAMKAYRMVPMPDGRVDIITSSLGEITDKMMTDYAATGMFESMDVVNANSQKESKVVKLDVQGRRAFVQTAAQKSKGKGGNWTSLSNLLPNSTATQTIEAPELYSAFRDFAMTETSNRINQTGQAYDTSWFDESVFHRLPELAREFLDQAGVSDVGVRAALVRYFDIQRVEDARAMAPDESRMNDEAVAKRDAIHEALPQTPDVHEYAALRGFSAVPSENGVGYVLEDQLSPMKYPMKDEDAVKEFLNTFQRDMPDLSPSSPVPVEIADIPTANRMHVPHTVESLHAAAIDDILWMESYLDDPFMGEAGDAHQSDGSYFDAGGGPGGAPPGSGPSWMYRPQDNVGGTGMEIPVRNRQRGAIPPPPPPPPPPNRPYNLGSPEQSKLLGSGTKADFVRRQLEGMSAAQLRSRYHNALTRYVTPMRVLFSNMEEALNVAGAKELRPARDADELNQLSTIAHNEGLPIMERVGELLSEGRADNFYRNGKWMRIWAIGNPGERQIVASSEGFTVEEVQAMDKIDDELRKMYGTDYKDGIAQFKEYHRKVAQAQARGEWDTKGYEPASENFPAIKHYTQHAADVKARFLIADPRQVLPDFIRSFTFNKHVANKWNDTYNTWNAVKNFEVDGKKPFQEVADDYLDWMDVTQKGFQPKGDNVLDGFHQAFNATIGKATGAPITRGEARKIFSTITGAFYNAVLGLKSSVSVRDATQPLQSIPWTGVKHLAGTYADLGSSSARSVMMARAEAAGVITKGLHFETPGTFEGIVQNTFEEGMFTPEQLVRREMFAKLADQIRDFFGARVRKLASYVKPLGFYGKQQEVQQMVVGEATYRNFMEKAAEFTSGQAQALSGGGMPPTFNGFASKVGFDSFGNPFTRQIKELMDQGRLEDAAHTVMRQVVLETQFGSGVRHAPAVTRTTAGRVGSSLGNFSIQELSYFKRALSGGNPRVAASVLGVAGALGATLYGLSRKTGWNFNALNPAASAVGLVGFTPAIQGVADLVQAGAAASSSIQADQAGRPQNQQDQQKISSLIAPENVVHAVNKFNPLAGVGYNYEGAQLIAQSENPILAAIRFAALGSSGMKADVGAEQFMDGARGVTRKQLREQPIISPVAQPVDRSSTTRAAPTVTRMGSSVPLDSTFIKQQIDTGTHGKGGGAF